MQLFLFTRPNPEDCQKLMRISRSQYESKLAYEVKSNPRRFFAHVRRNRHLKQRLMALRADDGVVLTDFPNMARILANYYVSVYRTDEGRALHHLVLSLAANSLGQLVSKK